MDFATGTTSQRAAPAALRAVPDADTQAGADALTAGLEESDDVGADVALLRDAATLVTARRRLDGWLLQLAANPFDPAAYRGLGCYLVGPGAPALAAYERVSASTVRGS